MFKLLCTLLIITLAVAEDIDYYDTLDDHFDFENASFEEFRDMMKCLADKGPCTELTESYRKHYPHAMYEACSRCSIHQKHLVRVLLNRMKNELPELYWDYRNLHDPEGKYYDKFEAAVAGY